MKHILSVAASLLFTITASAQSFIVYAKGDYSPVTVTTPATKPADARRATFLSDLQSDLARPANFETHMTLIAAPAPAWGKKIPGAGGTIKFHDTFGIALQPSAYELRFYVKDTADHTIFLYHDYFKFTVE